MSADLYFTWILLLFFFLFCQLSSKLAERNSTKIGYMLGSAIWKCMSKIWGIPFFEKSGPKTTFFSPTSQLNGNAYISGMKHDIHNRASALTTTRVSYIVSKWHELSSTNGFKLDPIIYPLYVNSAFYFIARLRRRRSANGTQPHFAKRWTVNRDNNLP